MTLGAGWPGGGWPPRPVSRFPSDNEQFACDLHVRVGAGVSETPGRVAMATWPPLIGGGEA
jgi:hypothetical protein